MTISIITVCLNSSATILKTFHSVRNQTFKSIEYIVIDGSSTDGTVDIIKNNSDIISKWISEKDNGLYDAMNKGIKMATGDLIGILNADDIFFNDNVLEDVFNYHKMNTIDASVGNIIQKNSKGKVNRYYTSKYWSPEKLKIGYMPPHPSIFFKSELFLKHGLYHQDFKIGADYELITRFFLKNKISWSYSGITTTEMLIGGLSSSGYKSYTLISQEIIEALNRNEIKYSKLKIKNRWAWKLLGYLR